MSEPENFLSRWSRRKLDAEEATEQPDVTAPGQGQAPAEQQPAQPDARIADAKTADAKTADAKSADQPPEQAFDISTLPPIDSIGVGTDITSFLQKGVPLELTRAALRRAWSADPTIRDFIGIAENQWDFASGSDLPGFGPLAPSTDVRRLVAEVFGPSPAEPPVGQQTEPDGAVKADQKQTDLPTEEGELAPPAGLASDNQSGDLPQNVVVHRKEENTASQQINEQSDSRPPGRRGHGGALPQ